VKQFEIAWLDSGKEPQCAPNPAYPDGVDLDMSDGHWPSCKVELPYPAQRIGVYLVACMVCGRRVSCTTAGRVDDPRSIRVRCGMGIQ
jgi:hypothetical protein